MPPKTLHLTNSYHQHSGGIRTMYHALLEQANREHRLMRLVVPAEHDREERVGHFGLIYHVRAPRAPVADRRYRVLLPHRFCWPGVGRLWKILEREAPDVVEVADKYSLCYLAGLVRRLCRSDDRPTLIGLSCERLDDNVSIYLGGGGQTLNGLARTYLGRVYIGMFDAHIANSEYTAAELRGAMVAPHLRAVHVCPMGVHLPRPMMPDVRQEMRRKLVAACGGQEVPLVMYAGRLAPEKHVDVLPDVMAMLLRTGSRAHMVVLGDGPLREQLQVRLKAVAPGRAHFLGHIDDRPTLSRCIASSDVFLHPNPREPFGIGPLEAMAAGTPLVASDAGGVLSYATCDNAWLTKAEPAAFVEAIQAVLRGGAERVRRTTNAQLTARQFTWTAAASRLFRTYDQAHATRLRQRRAKETTQDAAGVWG